MKEINVKAKKGIIRTSELHIPPTEHELATASYFAEMGKDVDFIRPSNIPGVYRPDIVMDGIEWEIKSPCGSSKRTLEKNYHKAALQSQNIIFDLRRSGVPEKDAVQRLMAEFRDKHTKQLLIICKTGELIEIRR